MKNLKNGIAADLVHALLHTRCQRLMLRVASDDHWVPSFFCIEAPAILGAKIAHLYGLIDGEEGVYDISGSLSSGFRFDGGGTVGDQVYRVEHREIVVSRTRSFWFQARLKQGADTFDTDCVDFLTLLRALQDSPGETLFLGDWDDEEEEGEALAAFGLGVPKEEPA